MSKAHSRPRTSALDRALFVLLAVVACGSASALQSNRSQPINVAADHQQATLGNNGQVTLTGHVTITQGSLVIQGSKAVGYENNDGQWDHAIVTGAPAQFRQQLDNGSLVSGSADTIEYLVAENTVILTGHASVVQQGRGQFHGAKLTYNTDTGQMAGEGGAGGQVHMTFMPKTAAPVPVRKSVPAPAATAGTH